MGSLQYFDIIIAIAMMNGILRRSLGVFPDLAKEIE